MHQFLARLFSLGLMATFFSQITACAVDSEIEDDEIVTVSGDEDQEGDNEESEEASKDEFEKFASEENEEEDPDGDLTAEEIPEKEELTEEEETFVQDFPASTPETAFSEVANSSASVDSWTPNNNGPSPTPVNQADLSIQCQRVGSGLEPGYYRYGCNAFKQDGKHYGIVKGWWNIKRSDGNRAKSKSLNFREGGYDMAFDVLASDADGGIQVSPGMGEQAPLIVNWGK